MSYLDPWDMAVPLAEPPNWTDTEAYMESALGLRRATRRLLGITQRRDAAGTLIGDALVTHFRPRPQPPEGV